MNKSNFNHNLGILFSGFGSIGFLVLLNLLYQDFLIKSVKERRLKILTIIILPVVSFFFVLHPHFWIE